MAKILTFRHKGESASEQAFLQDGDDTLPFRTTTEGRTDLGELTLSSFTDAPAPAIRDWSNQELADLFRVKRLLDAAGVPCEIDRGLTDEGDPWFVFCGGDGEVFIHLCRIGTLYVLDSPNILKPLRGMDFNGLISDFTNRSVPRAGQAGEVDVERRVIRLERGGKIRLHPSALLAALIWTLLLASDDLVLLTPEDGGEDAALDKLVTFDNEDGAQDSMDDMPLIAAELVDTTPFADGEHGHRQDGRDAIYAAEADLLLKEMQGQQGLGMYQNGYALGLSTIAIAMGIMSETILMDDRRKILDGLQSLGLTAVAEETGDGEAAADGSNPVIALLDGISEFLDRFLGTQTAQADTPETETRGLADIFEDALAFADSLKSAGGTDVVLTEDAPLQPEAGETDDVAALDAKPEAPDTDRLELSLQPLPVDDTLAAQDMQPTVIYNTLALFDIVQSLQPTLQEFMFGTTRVQATFDLTDETLTDTGIIDLLTPTGPATDPAAQDDDLVTAGLDSLRAFNDKARAFIDYVMATSQNVDMIALNRELILIDQDAIGGQRGDSAYVMSWELDDGGVISMVGLRSEFQEFDLIA